MEKNLIWSSSFGRKAVDSSGALSKKINKEVQIRTKRRLRIRFFFFFDF